MFYYVICGFIYAQFSIFVFTHPKYLLKEMEVVFKTMSDYSNSLSITKAVITRLNGDHGKTCSTLQVKI